MGTQNFVWNEWRAYCLGRRPKSVCGWFAIPPGSTKGQVRQQFERHLERLSEDHPELFSENKGGRGGPADALSQIAAHRILCGRSPAAAAKFDDRVMAHRLVSLAVGRVK